MAIAYWNDHLANRDNVPVDLSFPNRHDVVRVSDESFEFPAFGFNITAKNGWSFLRIDGRRKQRELYFIDPSAGLVVSMKRVQFLTWPPKPFHAKESQGNSVSSPTTDDWFSRVKIRDHQPPVTIQYKNLGLEWYSTIYRHHTTARLGRIKSGNSEVLLRAIAYDRKFGESAEIALGRLLDEAELR